MDEKDEKDEFDAYFDRLESRIKAIEALVAKKDLPAQEEGKTKKAGGVSDAINDELEKEKQKLEKIKASIKKRLL